MDQCLSGLQENQKTYGHGGEVEIEGPQWAVYIQVIGVNERASLSGKLSADMFKRIPR